MVGGMVTEEGQVLCRRYGWRYLKPWARKEWTRDELGKSTVQDKSSNVGYVLGQSGYFGMLISRRGSKVAKISFEHIKRPGQVDAHVFGASDQVETIRH
jgi:hypothetical protein